VHGAAAVPAHGVAGFPPTVHVEHGLVAFDVSTVREFSSITNDATPVVVSNVPVTGVANVFSTQLEFPPAVTGSGLPNRHPTFVQSKLPGFVAWLAAAPLTVQLDPVHDNAKRFADPAGVGPSGTVDAPPPSDSFPHSRFLIGNDPPVSRNVCPQNPLPTVGRNSSRVGPLPTVVVVVLVVVDVVVVVVVDAGSVVEVVVVDPGSVVEVVVVLASVVEVVVELVVDVVVELVVEVVVDVVVLLVVDVVVDEVVVEVVVLVVATAPQAAGYGDTSCGIAAASVQSVLNAATQSTQSTRSPMSVTGPAHDDAPIGVTAGHVAMKPTAAGVRSPLPSHNPSNPPHRRQIVRTLRSSAFARIATVLPSPGSGHTLACTPASRRSQQRCKAFAREATNLDAPLMSAR
jgi:hypothetical protein